MGAILERLFSKFYSKTPARIIMLGLDASGKSTILYRMRIGDISTTIPEIGINIETVRYRRLTVDSWDIGGDGYIRRISRHYYHNTQGLIYVVDASDTERIDQARDELNILLQEDELKDSALLVLANKQDLPSAVKPSGLADKLGLSSITDRPWFVQGSCSIKGDGLYDGIDWLINEINKKFNG